jgi:hypothetical protein
MLQGLLLIRRYRDRYTGVLVGQLPRRLLALLGITAVAQPARSSEEGVRHTEYVTPLPVNEIHGSVRTQNRIARPQRTLGNKLTYMLHISPTAPLHPPAAVGTRSSSHHQGRHEGSTCRKVPVGGRWCETAPATETRASRDGFASISLIGRI